MTKTVTLLDGTEYTLETMNDGFVCLICAGEYDDDFAPCDNTIDCAFDDGEHLVQV